jgi:uncharacterized membrane protein (UPF0127 family)
MRSVVVTLALLSLACTSSPREANGTPPPKSPPPSAATGPGEGAAETPPSESPRVSVKTPSGTHSFSVELAQNNRDRARGLMFRDEMADGHGMLFIFPRSKVQSFWMKNTHIPLDMLFIDENGVVVGIVENAEPMTTTSRSVGKPSQYVLELNGGMCRRLGIAAGQRFSFEGIPGHPSGSGGPVR